MFLLVAVLAAGCVSGRDSGLDETAGSRSDADGETVSAGNGDDATDDGEADGQIASDGRSAAAGDAGFGRADITPQGNRVLEGAATLGAGPSIDVDLPGVPVQVLAVTEPGGRGRWYVALDSGDAVVVDEDGTVTATDRAPAPPDLGRFTDPLPDGRVVTTGDIEAALVGPTDRYPHGVLGDRLEASAVEVHDRVTGARAVFGPEAPTVIEGIAPMLADVDQDGDPEVLVTHSNAEVGAWLAVWSLDGELLAQSEPIGQGNRWRNQLAVASVGPAGELEVIDVRTPHIGGTVQYFRMVGDELVLVAGRTGFTSHQIGSRNLDLAVVIDGNGDGVLDVVLPTDDRSHLGVLTRTDDGVEVSATVELAGRLTTNVAPATDGAGGVRVAVGTDERLLHIWPAP